MSVSVRNGFAFLHRISWDPCNEAEDLIPKAKRLKQEHGCYPERICADRIYLNTRNHNFCTTSIIRLSGKRLGRPPKDPEVNAAHRHLLSADQQSRNEVEGYFGSGKRKYSLKLMMPRLAKCAESSISMVFLVMCAEKIRRLLRIILSLYLHGSTPGHGQAAFGWSSGIFACSRQPNRWSLDKTLFMSCLRHGPWLQSSQLAICFCRSPYVALPVVEGEIAVGGRGGRRSGGPAVQGATLPQRLDWFQPRLRCHPRPAGHRLDHRAGRGGGQ